MNFQKRNDKSTVINTYHATMQFVSVHFISYWRSKVTRISMLPIQSSFWANNISFGINWHEWRTLTVGKCTWTGIWWYIFLLVWFLMQGRRATSWRLSVTNTIGANRTGRPLHHWTGWTLQTWSWSWRSWAMIQMCRVRASVTGARRPIRRYWGNLTTKWFLERARLDENWVNTWSIRTVDSNLDS